MPSADQMYDEAIDLKEAGKLEDAVGKLEELIAEHPDFTLAHAGLSVFYGKLDRHGEAVEHAQKVCDLEPDDSFSYMALSIVCQKAGKMTEAEQAMSKAMEKQWPPRRVARPEVGFPMGVDRVITIHRLGADRPTRQDGRSEQHQRLAGHCLPVQFPAFTVLAA